MLSSINMPRPVAAIFGATLFVIAGCSGASSDEPATSGTPSDSKGEVIDGTVTGALGEMNLGSPDAKVTVIEYASVTCPACASFHENIFPEIKEKYVDTGKVRFVFREFPTAPANLSIAGSMIARCAADKGGSDAYFLVLDSLFKTQRTWIYSDQPRDELIKIAAQVGMNETDLDACINRKELLDFLNENIAEGSDKYDINSTPSFVINGQLRRVTSLDGVSKALDEALEAAGAETTE